MDYETARARLIEHLRGEIGDEPVLDAMSRIPRELFMPPAERSAAYEDRPLPIGYGQTISQPYIIALMTSMLELTGREKVLEVGTGSGYQGGDTGGTGAAGDNRGKAAGSGGSGKASAQEIRL